MTKRKKKTQLTLKEQCDLLHGEGNWHIAGIPRLDIPSFEMHDGPVGLRYLEESSGLEFDADREAVCYPSPCLTACSFDVELMKELGVSIANECLANHTNMILAPGVNIKRNPLCGRNFEYLSEDPYLSGKMAAAYINGVQQQNVGACLKHFACNSQESHRMVNNSIVDQRALHELYLKPFEIAIKESDPWAVMSSYNKINGFYASDNDYLLKDVLRNDWRYTGVVMSDWGGTNDFIDSHNHGLDVEMPCGDKKRTNELISAYRFRRITGDVITRSSDRVLKMYAKASQARFKNSFDYRAAHELAVKAAAKSMVLLKNDGLLPLLNLNSTCVIGDLARIMRYQGAGSSQVKPKQLKTFVDLINEGREKPIPFASGYFLDPNEDDHRAMMDAVDIASSSESAIVFIGLPPESEAEGIDRENMLLPEDQLAMLEAVSEVNSNIVVVLCCGSPTELPFLKNVKAVLLAYLGGEGLSEAVLKILTGKVCPSGKLAETWPIHLMDVPSFGFYPGFADFSLYRESIFVGYRYYLTCDKPVNFPFGHGLSYATFDQSLTLSGTSLKGRDSIVAKVTVTNTSKIDAEKVIQLYAEPRRGEVFKALRTLIGFTKVSLKAHETKTVNFTLNLSTFAHFDIESKSFQTESDSYLIELCESSAEVVASVSLSVREKTYESLQAVMPAYYNLPKDGFLLADDSFEALLGGQEIPTATDRKSRPFTLNSTISDISWTWIGKQIIKTFEKSVGVPPNSPNGKAIYASLYGTPIRNLGMGGAKFASPRFIASVLSMANGHFIKGAFQFLFSGSLSKKG